MRSVGQMLLAVVLVVGALSGGVQAAGATHSSSDARSPSSVTADGDSPLPERAVPFSSANRPARLSSTRGQVQSAADVFLSQEFRLTPERPGHVAVTHNFTLADRIANLKTTVPRRGVVADTVGFTATNETIYQWDGHTDTPSITYRLPVNETGTRSHAATNGSLLFADVGDWALFRRPSVTTRWQAFGRDPVTYDRQTVTNGPGAAGDSLVYLGAVTLYPRTTANQTFRLAVPAAAGMRESPDDVLDAMERASTDLDVGDRDSSVFAVVAPTDGVPWAVRGLSISDAAFWVGADERLASTDNIWIHEYVHTRQAYDPTTTMRWTKEGFASYYAAHQALQYESVTFEEFATAMNTSTNGTAKSTNSTVTATLADPSTWDNRTAYRRGALVAGQFDRRIRLESGNGTTLDAVVAELNADTDTVNASEFFDAVASASNQSVRQAMRQAVYTNRSVPMWNRSQHVAAFGSLPARFVYGLPRGTDSGEYRVRGPYRNASLAGNDSFSLVTGESFVVRSRVRNVGNALGYFDVGLAVNGTIVDSADGQVPAGSVREVPLSHTFTSPGVYEIAVGNDTATVTVDRPATASIVGFRITRGSIEQYQSATVNVSVRNDSPIPARRVVRIGRNNETVANRSVRLAPETSRSIDVQVAFPEAGNAEVLVDGVGSIQVAVEPIVRQVTATPEPIDSPTDDTSSGTGHGIPPIVALFALLATVFWITRRRQ